MQFANNKFIATLVISNIIAFSVIFILIWMLWNNNTTKEQSTSSNIITQSDDIQKKSTVKTKTVMVIDAIIREVKSSKLEPDEQVNIDSSDTESLSDKEYISAFKKMKSNQKPVLNYTEKEVSTIKASANKSSAKENNKNNLNVVDVSQAKSKSSSKTLAQQVSSLVDESTNDNTSNSKKNPGWQNYLKKLNTEGEERKNEMRTIKVKRGETLWRISIRAYGTGFKYKTIFKANPHLTSPHSISTGEMLKVPL
ncbi:hypothetical protein MNBD_GAMMA05-1686 [hydrothermal vent metagenome]|uniref:LysM domain-containing protein n=1 Tax=hydrothermal vent metagenome TaxID=652676 RepID=A0A3B0WG39_9ZZZZ